MASRRRFFTIPAGAPFLATLARALLDGALVGPFDLAADPLALARATIFLPTRRAARAFAAELAALVDVPALLLPRIVPLGDMDEAEGALRSDAAQPFAEGMADLAPPVGEQERLITLAGLVLAWSRRLGEAVVRPEPGDALLVAATPADALSLAGDLAALLDTLAIEGRSFADLKGLVPEAFDRYWEATLTFLAIAAEQWPKVLAERGLSDVAAHRDILIRRRAALYRQGEAGPVIAAGSTGSMPATAELLSAIAGLPRGAVVLPGLDSDLDDAAFALIGGDAQRGLAPAAGHPQALLLRLLAMAGIGREEVVSLGGEPPALRVRSRLISQAMRPAETTEAWAARSAEDAAATAEGLADVAVIEAADEGEEALAIAVALREAIETPGRTAALVTPDRGLAERVAAALGRWNIEIDDSAGKPLDRAPAGVLARLVAQCAASEFEPQALVGLWAHPLATFGLDRAQVLAGAEALEIGVLRGALAPARGLAELRARLETARAGVDALHPRMPARKIGVHGWNAAVRLLDAMQRAFDGFDGARFGDVEHDIAALATAHRAAFERVAAQPSDDSDRLGVEQLFSSLDRPDAHALRLGLDAYPALFGRFAGLIAVHPPMRAHRRLKIWGLLEARLLTADRIVAGGLVETVWPPVVRTDPFLNRAMRAQLGLPAPERRIGQSAHDFAAACGAPEVILARALKVGGVPTVPSRFLQRLATCAGPQSEAWTAAKARGARYVDLARRLDRPAKVEPAARPQPRPPAALQPTRLSVTEIETLVRDPYAIYARHVLALEPLEPLSATLDARLLGSLVHEVLDEAARRVEIDGPDYAGHFLRAAAAALDANGLPPRLRAFLDARFAGLANSYAEFERARRDGLDAVLTEQGGSVKLTLADGTIFTLSARADRIEKRSDGSFGILDFKTGQPPGKREVAAGYAPQLTLEAAMLARGGFRFAPAGARVASLCHVKLATNGGPADVRDLAKGNATSPPLDLDAKPAEHLARLVAWLDELRAGRRGFVSRRYPKHVREDAPTNHLARAQEWMREMAEEP